MLQSGEKYNGEQSLEEHHKKKYAQSEEKSLLSTTLTRKELDVR